MDNWTLMHRYRRLAKRGIVNTLVCPDCRNPVALSEGPDGDPVLWCSTDSTIWNPGLQFYADMRAVVSEHYLE